MPTANVAIACCRRTADAGPDDLYPDPDAGPLQAALRDRGADSTLVSWDDSGVRWSSFSHVVVSSTWDSVDRPSEYLEWARHMTAETILVNSAATIEWGLDKRHQQQLAAAGVPVIPTTWIAPGEAWAAPELEFVVKPAISAGGRQTARYLAGDREALAHVDQLHAAGQTVMLQPYLPSIDREGEINVVLIEGVVSHAVLKRPALAAGEGVVNRPWERMAWDGLVAPCPQSVAVALQTVDIATAAVGGVPTYARVDLINGADNTPLVLEVEVIDPYLSLDMDHGAADRLAAALIRP